MKRPIAHFALLLSLSLLLAAPLAAQGDEETTPMIPQVKEFHSVIYVLWHKGYPEKDYSLIKSKEPEVAKFAEELPGYPLPGILRDKKEKWDVAVKAFLDAATAFSNAVMNDEKEKLLEATEILHSSYEGMIRTLRPVMKELDAYHQVLYKIYHRFLPDYMLDELQEASVALGERCADLLKAEIPKKLEPEAKQFEKNRKALCAATVKLVAVAETKDAKAVKKAVEEVHTKYQLLEKMFD